MKKKVGLIGKGKWGSLIKSKLSTTANLEFVFGQNKNLYKLVKKKKFKLNFYTKTKYYY